MCISELSKIPPEVLLLIFERLHDAVRARCRFVCREWNHFNKLHLCTPLEYELYVGDRPTILSGIFIRKQYTPEQVAASMRHCSVNKIRWLVSTKLFPVDGALKARLFQYLPLAAAGQIFCEHLVSHARVNMMNHQSEYSDTDAPSYEWHNWEPNGNLPRKHDIGKWKKSCRACMTLPSLYMISPIIRNDDHERLLLWILIALRDQKRRRLRRCHSALFNKISRAGAIKCLELLCRLGMGPLFSPDRGAPPKRYGHFANTHHRKARIENALLMAMTSKLTVRTRKRWLKCLPCNPPINAAAWVAISALGMGWIDILCPGGVRCTDQLEAAIMLFFAENNVDHIVRCARPGRKWKALTLIEFAQKRKLPLTLTEDRLTALHRSAQHSARCSNKCTQRIKSGLRVGYCCLVDNCRRHV